jgi:replicative superfamily II helicase
MGNLFKVSDQNDLVESKQYPNYAKFPFQHFNPVQSRIFDFYNQDCNAVIASSTSSGKTVSSEMLAASQIREKGGKILYLAPMKALAKEKYDDWTKEGHHFSDLNISICTGDYRLTADRQEELKNADIIILTSEMLNSRCRNMESEKNDFLIQAKICIVDEAHLLTVPGRGDHLEVGLMNLTKINKDIRIVLLSATMPNVDEIAEWVSKSLSDKDTYLLLSKFRPCPLGVHYETYFDTGKYEDQELEKISKALEIMEDNEDDKFLIFVHTKRTGELLKTEMKKRGMEALFHSADLTKEQREKLESSFKDKGKDGLQYLIATSTIAWGCNLPARRVIILGMHRGMSEVETYDIWQMAGRAGRPGFDPRGDVYILLPESKADKHRARLQNPQNIDSKLLDNIGGHYKTLAFHIVSEIHHNRIKTKDDIKNWYSRTLANYQSKGLNDSILNSTVDLLIKCGAIKEEDGIYKVTSVGMVSSMFYYSPFDVADLRKNFMALFKSGNENDDLWVSIALGNIDSIKMGIVSKAEKEDIYAYQNRISNLFGKDVILETAIKGGYAYYCAMNGLNPGSVATTMRMYQWDFPRLIQVLQAIDSFGCKWNKSGFFRDLQSRVIYGVKSELLHFVNLPDIGKVRAERLWSLGFRTLNDIVNKRDILKSALNFKEEKVQEIVREAQKNLLLE